ncbi:MAG: FxLYD domain-containing protein [Nitrososphaeraceae archaeon]
MKITYLFLLYVSAALMFVTSTAYGQEKNDESTATTGQTIELLHHEITHDDFFNELVGQVKNSFNTHVTFIKVTATFYDKDDNVLNTAFTYTDPQDLPPKSKGSFSMLIGGDIKNIDTYDVTITWNGAGSGINMIEDMKYIQ